MAKKMASREKARSASIMPKSRRPKRRAKRVRKPNLQLTDYLLESHPELGC